MTAPNHALLVTLLAVFTACVGYAVGRLHQWYRTGLDRDEAYRDGYETATRSVFSTAARLIAPRRSARGTASVTPAPVPAVADSPSGPAPSASSPAEAAPSAPASRTVVSCTTSSRAESSPAESLPAESSPAGSSLAESMPAESSLAEPFAAETSLAEPFAAETSPVESSPAESSPVAGDGPGGRHLVPDELVQAPTYRLAPDRVARAKVREVAAEDEGQETTTRLPSVPAPRPRSS